MLPHCTPSWLLWQLHLLQRPIEQQIHTRGYPRGVNSWHRESAPNPDPSRDPSSSPRTACGILHASWAGSCQPPNPPLTWAWGSREPGSARGFSFSSSIPGGLSPDTQPRSWTQGLAQGHSSPEPPHHIPPWRTMSPTPRCSLERHGLPSLSCDLCQI